jgi:hypothetical protein
MSKKNENKKDSQTAVPTVEEPETVAADGSAATDESVSADDRKSDRKKRYQHKYQVILKFVVAPILALLAIASLVVGILFATVYRPSPKVNASTTTTQRYVATAPGMLDLVAPKVTMTLTSSAQICAAVGSSQDVAGWLANQQYTAITGLSTWQTLSASTKKMGDYPRSIAAPADAPEAQTADSDKTETADAAGVPLSQSDMWDSIKCANTISFTNDASTSASDSDSSKALIIDAQPTGDTPAQVDISFAWVRTQMPNISLPYYFAAGLLILAAVLCFVLFSLEPHRRRKAVTAGKNEKAEGEMEPRWVHDHLSAKRGSHRQHIPSQTDDQNAASHVSSHRKSQPAKDRPVIINGRGANLVAQRSHARHTGRPLGSGETLNETMGESVNSFAPEELDRYFEQLREQLNVGIAEVKEQLNSDESAEGAENAGGIEKPGDAEGGAQ